MLSFLIPILGYTLYMVNSPVQFAAANTNVERAVRPGRHVRRLLHADVPDNERQLCPTEPLNARHSPDYYAHTPTAPIFHVVLPPGKTLAQIETDFAKRAITQQPFGLVKAVTRDAVRAFTWDHSHAVQPGRADRTLAVPDDVPGLPERGHARHGHSARRPVRRRAPDLGCPRPPRSCGTTS